MLTLRFVAGVGGFKKPHTCSACNEEMTIESSLPDNIKGGSSKNIVRKGTAPRTRQTTTTVGKKYRRQKGTMIKVAAGSASRPRFKKPPTKTGGKKPGPRKRS